MGELLKIKATPEMQASLIQEHADLIDKVCVLQKEASEAVDRATKASEPLLKRAEEIENFLYGDTEKTTTQS